MPRNLFCKSAIYLAVLLSLSFSCRHEYTPKPRGYYRIAFPEKSYHQLDKPLPYTFLIPDYSYPERDSLNLDQPNWITIEVPNNHAQIHISYKEVKDSLFKYIEDSRTLVYKHSQKANSIVEQVFMNPVNRVYGTVYTLKGNAASPLQFYLTDSTRHFLRGALYIKEVPNYDSLRPVIEFLSKDVLQMIETTSWKEDK
jgi:gliding motility-associated lipoprotein GldD